MCGGMGMFWPVGPIPPYPPRFFQHLERVLFLALLLSWLTHWDFYWNFLLGRLGPQASLPSLGKGLKKIPLLAARRVFFNNHICFSTHWWGQIESWRSSRVLSWSLSSFQFLQNFIPCFVGEGELDHLII